MSDSGDYSELSAPVHYGQRRAASRIKPKEAGQTGRRNKQPRPLIGGDVVGSMKRGIKDHSGDLKRRESRLLFLCKSQKPKRKRMRDVSLIWEDSIAGALFCVLTAIWIKKLYAHWNN
jgi:hypothetical protein